MMRQCRKHVVGYGFALALFSVVTLAGCSSLPVIHPDMVRQSGGAPQLQGARGLLSPVQSKAVLDRLKARGTATDIFDRHLALEEAIVGSPLTTGNQVLLLQDGPATYQAMFAAITAAKDHINMKPIFSRMMKSGDVSRRP